jgi:hypothetical protein
VLGDRTIANATIPVRAVLATAKRESLIRHNPAQGRALPPRQDLDGDEIKVFTPEQLAAVIGDAQSAIGCSSSSWRRPACGSARRSPSSACTCS